MSQNVNRKTGIFRSCNPRELVDVAEIVRKHLDIEAFPFGFAAPPQIERIGREPAGRKLLRRPSHITAMGVESMDKDDDGAGAPCRQPPAGEDLKTSDAFE